MSVVAEIEISLMGYVKVMTAYPSYYHVATIYDFYITFCSKFSQKNVIIKKLEKVF